MRLITVKDNYLYVADDDGDVFKLKITEKHLVRDWIFYDAMFMAGLKKKAFSRKQYEQLFETDTRPWYKKLLRRNDEL